MSAFSRLLPRNIWLQQFDLAKGRGMWQPKKACALLGFFHLKHLNLNPTLEPLSVLVFGFQIVVKTVPSVTWMPLQSSEPSLEDRPQTKRKLYQ